MSLLDSLRAHLVRWAAPANSRIVRGIPVLLENTRPDIADADVLARLDDALALVERHQPIRFRHLRRDLDAILIARFPARGAFLAERRTCLTELTFLARRDIPASVVATSILHEGVHARVHAFREHMGGRRTQDDLAREERLCRKAELAFGRSLPPELGAPVIERALATLSMDDADVAPAIDWSIAGARVAEVDRGT